MNNSTYDGATETNSKESSDDNREEEQTTLPAETSRDDPTKQEDDEDIPDKKKVIVVTPTSSNTEEKTTTTNTTQQPSSSDEKQEQSSVPAKAKEVGQTLKEKVKSAGMKTITKTEEKTKRIKDKSEQTAGVGPEKNAHDIQALDSTRLEKLAKVFEDTMSKIDQEPNYGEQERQLKGYKKLLEEQINVIDSRLKMAKRLKKSSR
ncbi:MAG: hypothetical protein JO327_07315 [Nitrososphaeraceae archaeon]|nr:hypothetical protein [Nitrososphaeraceae archaeon]MBV9667925.1 hypothetical protein [Nitrososphaeraceae archaeon]